ncbi:MAG TPA: DUF4349 domain-containing protein [Gaiellaceae bacterium]|nr:DUF4349 domain-containing protein [Gaiellaceae bacterium]
MSAVDGSELDGYEALVSELRANPPVAPERLRARVLEGAPAPRKHRSRKRKLVLVVVPLAAALAVGAAVVHGVVDSGSKKTSFAALEPTLRGNPRVPPSAVHSASVPAPQGEQELAPVAKSVHKEYFGPDTQAAGTADSLTQGSNVTATGSGDTLGVAAAPNARRSLQIPRNRLVHATAALQVGVKGKDLSAKTNEATQIVGALGGYAQSVSFRSSHVGGGEAVLSLRVPVQNAQKALTKLGGLGKLLSEQVSTQDLQAKVTHQTSAIGSLRRAIVVYEAALRSTTSATQRAELQIKLNNARRALAGLRHARAGTVAQAATASISLLLATNGNAIVAPQHHGSTRIGRLLGSAAHFLALEAIVVLYGLIVIAPLLLIAALVWWIIRERRRREERLLSTA